MQSQGNPKEKRNRHKRAPVKGHKGVAFRLHADGTRAYCYYDPSRGAWVTADGGLDEALEAQAKARGSARRGEKAVVVDRKARFSPLGDEWFASKSERVRPWTAKLYKDSLDNALRPKFGNWLVSAIGPDDVAEFIRGLEREGLHSIDPKRPKRPLSPSSVQAYVLPLKGILDLAVRRGIIAQNPTKLLLDSERPKPRTKTAPPELGEAQVSALVEASEYLARQPESRYNYSPLLFVASKTGLRLGELLGLEWRDVDLRGATIHVERQLGRMGEIAKPKTDQGVRDVPLSADVVERLRKLRGDTLRQPDEPVFASRNGGRLSHRNVQSRGFEPAAKWAELEGYSFHDLRHAAVSRLIASGVLSPTDVAAVAGHRDARITLAVYAHLWDRDKVNAAVRQAMGGASS